MYELNWLGVRADVLVDRQDGVMTAAGSSPMMMRRSAASVARWSGHIQSSRSPDAPHIVAAIGLGRARQGRRSDNHEDDGWTVADGEQTLTHTVVPNGTHTPSHRR